MFNFVLTMIAIKKIPVTKSDAKNSKFFGFNQDEPFSATKYIPIKRADASPEIRTPNPMPIHFAISSKLTIVSIFGFHY